MAPLTGTPLVVPLLRLERGHTIRPRRRPSHQERSEISPYVLMVVLEKSNIGALIWAEGFETPLHAITEMIIVLSDHGLL